MVEIFFELPPVFRNWLLAYIKAFVSAQDDLLAVNIDEAQDDFDLALTWKEGLSTDLAYDYHELLSFLGDESFGVSAQVLNVSSAESLLRAASALRLKLQQVFLSDINESILEEGELEDSCLSHQQRHAYQVYLFLAALQIVLLKALNPEFEEFF